MSEFFLELFSEEIPANLQESARDNLLKEFKILFQKQNIDYKQENRALSTPNRLIIYFQNINKQIFLLPKEIKGPSISAPEKAIEGFIKSNQAEKKKYIQKKH